MSSAIESVKECTCIYTVGTGLCVATVCCTYLAHWVVSLLCCVVGKLMEMHGDGAGGTRVDRGGYEPPVQEQV